MKRLATFLSVMLLFASFGLGTVHSQRPESPGKSNDSPSSEHSNKFDDEDELEDESDENEPESEHGRSGFAHIKSNKNKLQVTFEGGDEEEATGEGDIEEEFDVEDNDDGLKVRAHENASLVIRNKLAAQTHFPLKVNLDTNELIVTTPKGEKSVTVLPDAAVFNMLAANVLDQLGGKGGLQWLADQVTPTPVATDSGTITPSATPSATITPEVTETPEPVSTGSGEIAETPALTPTGEDLLAAGEESPIQLVLDEDGNLVYEIQGVKVEKFLGIFKVDVDRVVIVSAETGELIEVKHNLANKILDLLSVDSE